jgi:hypothetical protein
LHGGLIWGVAKEGGSPGLAVHGGVQAAECSIVADRRGGHCTGGDVSEQQDVGGVLEEVAAGWFGAGGGPFVMRYPGVEDGEGGWPPRVVFGPTLRAKHEDGKTGDAPRRMRVTTRVA